MKLASTVLVVGLLASCSGADEDRDVAAIAPEPAAEWVAMPESPLSARYDVIAVGVDDEVLFVGGTSARPCPPNADCVESTVPPHLDGAMFDVSSASWRTIAPAPTPVRRASTAVLDGVVYFATDDSFLSYEVDEDRWSSHPTPGAARQLVATDDGVVAFVRSEEHGDSGDQLFDPDTSTWSALPADPHTRAFDRSMVWAADRLVLLDVELVDQPNGREPSLYRAAALDLATGMWEQLPAPDIVAGHPTWFALGDLVVNPTVGELDGGEVNGWGRSVPVGGVLDLTDREWRPLPRHRDGIPWVFGPTAADAHRIVLANGWEFDGEDWHRLPRPPDDVVGASALGGDSVIVWGGVRWNGDGTSAEEILDDGWMLRLS